MKKSKFISILLLLFSINLLIAENSFPNRVLITNDDGINDEKMRTLAEVFSKTAETFVIAPKDDRSGSTHYAQVFSKHYLTVEKQEWDENIMAYSVDGFPADCVFLALKGIMKDNLPDLIISGINAGPNLGYDWLGSGTIGAARMASFWGIPAIAVSGFKSRGHNDLLLISEWIVKLTRSELISELKAGQYLTISFPDVPFDKIKGVKFANRAGILLDFEMYKAEQDSIKEIWRFMPPKPITDFPPDSDASYYNQGFIVITPMIADEIDYEFMNTSSKMKNYNLFK